MLAEEATGRQSVMLPALQTETLLVRLAGQSPLLQNRFGPQRLARLAAEQCRTGPRPDPPPREPEQEFRDALHPIDADAGRYGVPAAAVRKALCRAASLVGGELPMTRLRCLLQIGSARDAGTPLLEIEGSEPVMRADPVRLRSARGDVWSVAYRPAFPVPWGIEVPFLVSPDLLAVEKILRLCHVAGLYVGLGSYRLEVGGPCGAFRIESAELRSL